MPKTVFLVIDADDFDGRGARSTIVRRQIFGGNHRPVNPNWEVQFLHDLSRVELNSVCDHVFSIVVVLQAELLTETLFCQVLHKLVTKGHAVLVYEDVSTALTAPDWVQEDSQVILAHAHGRVPTTGVVDLKELRSWLIQNG